MEENKYYCRIDGKIYNLEKIQQVIDECPGSPNYGKIFLLSVEEYGLPQNSLIEKVIEFNNNEIPADYNETLEKMRACNRARKNSNSQRCPKCNGTNFTPVRKKFSLLTGFATNKVELVCNNCGHRISPK